MEHKTDKRARARKNIKNILLMILGTLILSFGTAVFIIQFDLVVGGMSGLSLILKAFIKWEFLTVDRIITILTWLLFFAGWIILGRGFAIKTLISAIFYPIGVSLCLLLVDPNVLGGMFCLKEGAHQELSLLLAAVGGGGCVGTGCALTFMCGGSTGGVDIIAFTICKIFKRVKSSTVLFAIDSTIIIIGMFITQDLILSMLGILSAVISATVIDKVFVGGSAAFVAQIVTECPEEINRAVIEQMERSTTILDVVGGYSQSSKKMLLVSFNMRQYAQLLQVVHACDKKAFVTIHKAHEINGEGWTR